MAHSFASYIQATAVLGSVMLALLVIALRIKAASKPATIQKILIPPLGMSTGFLMFFYAPARIPWSWGIASFIAGAIFLSVPLIVTSKFRIVNQRIFLHRSKAFVWILLILLAVRLMLHSYLERYITLPQTGALFFILAFGMIMPWRIAMYKKFRVVEKQIR